MAFQAVDIPLGGVGGPLPSDCIPAPATCAVGPEALRSKVSLRGFLAESVGPKGCMEGERSEPRVEDTGEAGTADPKPAAPRDAGRSEQGNPVSAEKIA